MKLTIFSHWDTESKKNCGKVVRLSLTDRELEAAAELSRGVYYARRCECGKWTRGQVVRGKDTGKVKTCNTKCESATAPDCDCPCRGENHGGRHAA